MKREAVISIIVLTYNHASYIEQALDSIMMQEIDVSYEVLIHDDVSVDGTRDILKRYAKQYPDVIKLYLRKKKAKSVTYASSQMLQKAQGKYIALLEGDDYWTDKEKLKKQYYFLESNLQYVAVTHGISIVNMRGEEGKDRLHSIWYDWSGIYTIKDFWYSKKYPGQTATLMCRNIWKDKDISIIYKGHDVIGDVSVYLLLLTESDIYRMDDVMSVWRSVRQKGKDNWNSIALTRNVELESDILHQRQLEWYQKKTGNYKLVHKRWIEEWEKWWNYVNENGLDKHMKERIVLLFMLIKGIAANQIGMWREVLRKGIGNES